LHTSKTLLVGSTQKRLFPHHPSIELFLVQSALDSGTMYNDTTSSKMFLELLGGGLSVTILIILHLSDIFLGLPHISFTRTVPVALHFLTIFLTVVTETETLIFCDNFLYPSPN